MRRAVSAENSATEQSLQPEEELRARIGLSGLSEVMRQVGPAVQPARSHAVDASVDSMAPHRGLAGSKHKPAGEAEAPAQSRPLVLYVLAGFGLFAFLAIVVFLLVVLVKGLNPAGEEPVDTGNTPAAIPQAADE